MENQIETTPGNGELLIDSEKGFYSADKTSCDKIKNATDAEFEEELKNFDPDAQFFLRIARQRRKEQEEAR